MCFYRQKGCILFCRTCFAPLSDLPDEIIEFKQEALKLRNINICKTVTILSLLFLMIFCNIYHSEYFAIFR